MTSVINPYEPSRPIAGDFEPLAGETSSDVTVTCKYRGWLTRKLDLNGRFTASIYYDGWGGLSNGERVYVNGVLVATPTPRINQCVAPVVDFELCGSDFSVAARIFVRASFPRALKITDFTLAIGDEIVYSENRRTMPCTEGRHGAIRNGN